MRGFVQVGSTSGVSVAAAAISISIGVWWVVERNASYGWVLQNLIGACFLITTTAVLRVPNLKIATLLLGALLMYDVFFVFITPFLTKDGGSVMVGAARGSADDDGFSWKALVTQKRFRLTPRKTHAHPLNRQQRYLHETSGMQLLKQQQYYVLY